MLTGFVVVAVIGILTLIVRFLLAHIKISQIINKIPGPPGLPLFGNALGFKHGGAEFFEQLCGFCEDYGRKDGIMKFWLGTHPVIALTSGEAAETVFNSSKHMSKSVMYRFVHPWLGTGLLTSTGAKWQFRRKHLTPTFHFKILNDFQVVFNEQTKVLVDKLDTMAGKGEFDIFPFITRCALDIICETAMGCNIEAQANSDSDYVKAVYKIGELIQQRLKKPWWWPNVIFNNLPAGKEHQKCLDILQGFTRKVIIERQGELENMLKTSDKASPQQVTMSDQDIDDQMEMYAKKGKKRMAFLDMLLYSARGENGMTFEGIQEEVDTFMFEGHDTTAGSMNWTCHLIGSYPDVQKKLQNEIDSVMKDKDHTITANDLKEFKYLDRVIKESLRIFPSVPMFGREISEDTNIAGYDIPKGTTAIVLPYSLHRDPRYFPDPEKFDPDRWLQDTSTRHPYSYVPFSAGLRNCIGQKFALMEEKTLLARLIHNFHITAKQKKEELSPIGELILRPEHGIRVEITSRR